MPGTQRTASVAFPSRGACRFGSEYAFTRPRRATLPPVYSCTTPVSVSDAASDADSEAQLLKKARAESARASS